jgi:hypothetical protein
MAYTPFDATKPDATAQTLTQMGQSERDNLRAIRDAVVSMGGFAGWNMAPSGGTAEQPATITYSKGSERVRASLTWGTTGGAAGNVTVAVYDYSSTSGSSYDTIGTKTYTYDPAGNVTATTWS